MVASMQNCLQEVECWMANNCLQLNDRKSQVVIFGSSNSSVCLASPLELLSFNLQTQARNLGAIFDCDRKLDKWINSVI